MNNIAEEWKIEEIGNICEIHNSKRIPLNTVQRRERKGNYPYYGANNVQDFIDDFIFDFNSVLLAEDGGYFEEYESRDIAQYATGKYWVNNHAHILTGRECLDTKFLYYSLVRKNICSWINTGTRSKLNQAELRQIKIAFPPIPEQKKIAEILTGVDTVITKINLEIKKFEILKKGIIKKLLKEGINQNNDSKNIPLNWEIFKLGEICNFTQGVQIPLDKTIRQDQTGFIRYLYINDFSSDKKKLFVENKFPTKIINKNDLVMANTGHTAGTIFRGKEGVLSNNAFKLSFSNIINSDFLYYYLSTEEYWSQVRRMFNIAGQPHVGHGNIANIKILLPSLKEQEKIVSIINSIELNLTKKNQKVSSLMSTRKSLMQDLLSGKK